MHLNIFFVIFFTFIFQMKNVHLNKLNSTIKNKIINRDTEILALQNEKFSNTKSQNVSLSKADECIQIMKTEDELNNVTERNWSCKVVNDRKTNIALFCSCSYEYKCVENQSIYFSLDYNKNLANRNKLNKINREADYQCENSLKKLTQKVWTCKNKINEESTSKDDEYYCECMHKKKCKFYRLADFY